MPFAEKMLHRARNQYKKISHHKAPSSTHVSSRDGDLNFYYQRYMETKSSEDKKALEDELDSRQRYDNLFSQFGLSTYVHESPQDFDCLRMMVGHVDDQCGRWTSYGLKYVKHLANICDSYSLDDISAAKIKISEHCNGF